MNNFVYTEAGHNHQNEDTVVVQAHPQDAAILLCALADGQGGQFGGAAASHVAVKTCLDVASSCSVEQLRKGGVWRDILSRADNAVLDDENAGYTTLIGICVMGDKLYGASCGDSAVLLINDGTPTLLTEKQRKNPPVGSGAAIPTAFSTKLRNRSQVLIVSDGVWKYVGWDAIVELCARQQGQQLILALRDLSLEQNAGKLPDDFSIALLQ